MDRAFREEIRRFYAAIGGRTLPIGLGCAYVGQQGDAAAQRGFMETLERAYAGGMRYFDTALLYGGSEFRVGRFLKGIERSTIFLATKAHFPAALTPEEAGFYVRQCLHNSLERLGVTQLDMFLIHDVRNLDQVLPPGGVMETLVAARAEGLLRYIGLGTREHPLHQEMAAHPEFDASLTYLDYNLLDQSAAGMIRFAAERGVGVVNGSPLMNGLLVGSDPRHAPVYPETAPYQAQAIRLYDFAAAHGLPLLALALQYPMLNPDISLTLTGPAAPAEIQASLAACQTEVAPEVWQQLNRELGLPLP